MPEAQSESSTPKGSADRNERVGSKSGSFLRTVKKWSPLHKGNYILGFQLVAAVMVGVGAYLYTKLIAFTYSCFFHGFEGHPYLVSLAAPLLFLIATWLVVRFAPDAKGSGIPQVLQAIDKTTHVNSEGLNGPLVSIKTACFKVFSSTVGIFGGASIGREGPTVQIASSVFAWTARRAKPYFEITDPRSFLVAGASAGIAAAFNTPLAGITFALEEIAEATFTQFKRVVMLSVIVGGITAEALGGNYRYFGHPLIQSPTLAIIPITIVIGVGGGLFGGFFAKVLSSPLKMLPRSWWLRALVCGSICTLFCLLSNGDTAGSGYETTRRFMDDPAGTLPVLFFPEKLMTTIFSYLSGMAGGIFSPCLSIGAGMGFTIGKLSQAVDLKACALIGMVAFFSGAVQAPLTAVIIIMEMTDQSMLIIPFMIAAFLAHGIGKLMMPMPLYRFLAFSSLGDESKIY